MSRNEGNMKALFAIAVAVALITFFVVVVIFAGDLNAFANWVRDQLS